MAERTEVLLPTLPDAHALEEVVCGLAGTLTTLEPGTVHIEMSTVDVEHKGRVRDRSAATELVQHTLDNSIASSAILKQRGHRQRDRGPDDGLRLRFSFALVVTGLRAGRRRSRTTPTP